MKTLYLLLGKPRIIACFILMVSVLFTAQAQNPKVGDVNLTTQEEVNTFGQNQYTSISGWLNITGSDIADLNPLNSLASIEFGVGISNCSSLTSLDGLNLSYIGTFFYIWDNPVLTDLSALQNLVHIGGSLQIKNNDFLTDLGGLQNLSFIGSLRIDNNSRLTNIDALQNINSTVGWVYVYNNDALINLDGFQNISSVLGFLEINDNNALTNINGLSSINYVGGTLLFVWNSSLLNLDGLSNLKFIGGTLYFRNNHLLTNLDVFENIESIGRHLIIRNNDGITNLNGLRNVTSIGGILEITGNDGLTKLDGLNNILSVIGDLLIQWNSILGECCGILPLLQDGFIGGVLNILNNELGCNSEYEIIFACDPDPFYSALNILSKNIRTFVDVGLLTEKDTSTLIRKLDHVQTFIEDCQIEAAIGMLTAFINQVNAMINSGKITSNDGTDLIIAANAIIDQLMLDDCSAQARIKSKRVVLDNYVLEQNYPNPFSVETEIIFNLPQKDHVLIEIHNINGQIVRTLISGVYDAGMHNVMWDGTGSNGSRMASGVYFYRLQTGDFVKSRKVSLL